MKNIFLIIPVLAIMTGCGNQNSSNEAPPVPIKVIVKDTSEKIDKDTFTGETADTTINPNLSLYDLKPLFKYNNLTEFNIEKFNSEEKNIKLNELSRDYFYLVWQNRNRKYNDDPYLKDFLYSWQSRDTNFIELIIQQGDIEYSGRHFTYLIYNKEQKLVDKFVLSSSSADGGWWGKASGKFTDKNTYEKIRVEYEITSKQDPSGKSIYEGDSTWYSHTIAADGKVTEKEIRTKHFFKTE